MARTRNIKPSFFDNDVLGNLPPLTRLLFIGLWCIADREGRLEDRPRRIKKLLLGYDDVTVEDTDGMLQQLHDNDFIVRYKVDGAAYIQVTNFTKHQNPHMKEKNSEIPPPPGVGDDHPGSQTAGENESAPETPESNAGNSAVAEYLSRVNPSASPMSIDELKGFVGLMGDEVCIRAMDIALDAKKATWPYIRGILRKWQGMGVTCLADIAEKEAQHGHHGTDSGGDTGKCNSLDRTIL